MYDVNFRHYTGPDGHIAFVTPVQGSNANYTYFYIDDITVDYAPDCWHVGNLNTLYAYGDSIAVTWQPGEGESEWEVSDGTNTYITNSDTMLFTGMRPNVIYNISVRGICGEGDTSTAVTLRTHGACGLLDSLPYTQDFENVVAGSSQTFDFAPCWH